MGVRERVRMKPASSQNVSVYLLQYNPWGRGYGNPPTFDQQGRIVKPLRARDENDMVK